MLRRVRTQSVHSENRQALSEVGRLDHSVELLPSPYSGRSLLVAELIQKFVEKLARTAHVQDSGNGSMDPKVARVGWRNFAPPLAEGFSLVSLEFFAVVLKFHEFGIRPSHAMNPMQPSIDFDFVPVPGLQRIVYVNAM